MKLWLSAVFLMAEFDFILGGCRNQEKNECESLCRKNGDSETKCEVRIAIILPNLTELEASLVRVSQKAKLSFSFQSFRVKLNIKINE